MIKNIVIVGGGTAGWMTASAFVKHLPKSCKIRLIESDAIATVGVGEATIPVIRQFNSILGIDEREFMSKTNASFKLGIRFENWAHRGDSYDHAFGYYGIPMNDVSFHHYWVKQHQQGKGGNIEDYNVPAVASEEQRYAHRQYNDSRFDSRYFYAFQFDASLYAQFLRNWSTSRGVTRTEGKVQEIFQNQETGYITSILLESGEKVSADLFIDCTGFRGILINQTMGVNFRDWSHWLPCNRAWAVSSSYPSADSSIPPYTRARALEAGWQWRIPLQNRSGDGNVFCCDFISEERGREQLLENIEGDPLNEPRLLKFTTGMRERLWDKNCVAIGLSAGFLEPLESTSIALIQATIMIFLKNFPDKDFDSIRRDEFNRRMVNKYEESRNFLILHYHAIQREDTEFWKYCKNMSVPDELRHRLDLFKETGYVSNLASDLFLEHNWLAVLFGQDIVPTNYDLRVNKVSDEESLASMESMSSEISNVIQEMPTHNQTLADYCAGDLISLIKSTNTAPTLDGVVQEHD